MEDGLVKAPCNLTFEVRPSADLLGCRDQRLFGNRLCRHLAVRRGCLVDGSLVGRLLLVLSLVYRPARIAQAEENFLRPKEDVHHGHHPIAHPQALVFFPTWYGVQDLACPLTQDSWNSVASPEVQVLQLEQEVVDRMHDPVEPAQAPPAP